jgi:predicted kinase
MIILLCGVSGVGKTWLRERAFPTYPHIDIRDIYKDLPSADWSMATMALATRVRKMLREHGTVVIEGYFLPGTQSRQMLMNELHSYDIEVTSIFVHAPCLVCASRIEESGENVEKRLDLLFKRWPYARGRMEGC